MVQLVLFWVLFYFSGQGISHLDSTSLVAFFGVVWVPGDCSQTEQGQENTVVAEFDTEEQIGRLAQLKVVIQDTFGQSSKCTKCQTKWEGEQ